MRFILQFVILWGLLASALGQERPFPPDTAAPPPHAGATTSAAQSPVQRPQHSLPQSDAATAQSTQQQAQPLAARPAANPAPAGARIATPPAQKRTKRKSRARAKPEPQPEASAIVTPPPPAVPLQLPPTAPTVSFRNGQMTLVAENSRLGDVLQAVRQQTGATIDLPPQAAEERIVVRLGPAPARDVLAALLNGSHYDYVIVGKEGDPLAVQRVMVTQRMAEGATPAYAGNRPMSTHPMPNPLNPTGMPGMSAPPPVEEQEAPEEPAPTPQTAQPSPLPGMGTQPLPGVQPQGGGVVQAAPDRNPPENQQQTPKTPEQLLEELKRMQQQQQQQQQPPKPPR